MKSSQKERILDTAIGSFTKHGFYKTSMEGIARTARVAKGSLYYHFESKELLFSAVINKEIDFLKEELLSKFSPEEDTRKTLTQHIMRRMEIMKSMYNYHETLRPEFFEFYKFLNEIKDELDTWERDKIIQLFDMGVSRGELIFVSDRKVYADVLVMTLKGLEFPFFVKKEYERLKDHIENLASVFTKGISKA